MKLLMMILMIVMISQYHTDDSYDSGNKNENDFITFR